MTRKQLFAVCLSLLPLAFGGVASARDASEPYVQLAILDIDPAQLDAYKAAVMEQIETAIRVEPGVLTLSAVADRDNPAHITVFEVYATTEAYRTHLESPHFRKYKSDTEKMVRSLRLVRVTPLLLGSK